MKYIIALIASISIWNIGQAQVKGVVAYDYDLTAHRLTITFNPTKITLDKIHALINAAGYDTEKSNATDAQYSRVHGCCKYRSMEQHP